MDERIYNLNEKINNDLINSCLSVQERNDLLLELKNKLPKDSLVVAQVGSSIGNVQDNALKALSWIKLAEKLDIGAIVFPEGFLVGYPCSDVVNKFPVIVEECEEWLNILALHSRKTKVFIGFVESNKKTDCAPQYYDSLAILSNGKIEKIVRKSVLNDTFGFNDSRYFCDEDIKDSLVCVDICGKKVMVLLGDMILQDKYRSILDDCINEQEPDFLINIATEVSRIGKAFENTKLLSLVAKTYNKPVLFVNQAGATENIVFNGCSRCFDKNGNIFAKAKAFDEQFFIVNPFAKNNDNIATQSFIDRNTFSLDYEQDMELVYSTLVKAIRNYFETTGFKRAVLGLSGGLDSTISAVLLADAIGAENVFGVSMPSKITSDDSKNDAKMLAQNLGIKSLEVSIKDICDTTKTLFDGVFSDVEKEWNHRYKTSFTSDNIQARSRAVILWGIANEFEACLPIATSDKSELYMGYATINGDMSGGYAPLADVTKTKLFALAKWMNANRAQKNAIPQSIIQKRPGAELAINPKTGKPLLAEEALMPYDFMDEVIWRIENKNESLTDMLEDEFLYEKNMQLLGIPVTKEQKLEWLNKFFRRMSFALFKWQLLPPAPVVDSHSINGNEYHQPVLSTKINYAKTSYDEKITLAGAVKE